MRERLTFEEVIREIPVLVRQAEQHVDRMIASVYAIVEPRGVHAALQFLEERRLASAARALRRSVG